MKVAILVDGPQQISPSARPMVKTVSSQNYAEIYYQFFSLHNVNLILFIADTVKTDKFLKFVEEYDGNLAVYFAGTVSAVLLSRFNKYENRRKYNRVEFPAVSNQERDVKRIKECI